MSSCCSSNRARSWMGTNYLKDWHLYIAIFMLLCVTWRSITTCLIQLGAMVAEKLCDFNWISGKARSMLGLLNWPSLNSARSSLAHVWAGVAQLGTKNKGPSLRLSPYFLYELSLHISYPAHKVQLTPLNGDMNLWATASQSTVNSSRGSSAPNHYSKRYPEDHDSSTERY